MRNLQVNGERLWESLMELAPEDLTAGCNVLLNAVLDPPIFIRSRGSPIYACVDAS